MSHKQITIDETDLISSPTSDEKSSLLADSQHSLNYDIAQLVASKASINTMLLTVFLQSTGFTVVLPSLWFYLKSLGGTQSFLGWVVAIYSFGQAIASPVVGWWSNKRKTSEPILVTLAISLVGNVMYSLAAFIPEHVWQVFVARFVVGLGAGNVAVCRAFVSHTTSINDRAKVMSYMSAAQGIGFVVGPAIGSLLSFVHFHIGAVSIDGYTAAGYVSALFNGINIVLMLVFFRDVHDDSHEDGEGKPKGAKHRNSCSELVSVFVCIYIFFIVIAVFSVFETMLTVVTSKEFGWGVTINGGLFLGAGVVSIVAFVIISRKFITQRFSDRVLLIIGLALLFISLLAMATWGPWQKKLPPPQFLIGSFILSVGYPIASAMIYTIYSKVLHPKLQGTMMGWLTMGGSLSRMAGPIWASNAFTFGGGELLFMGTAGGVLTSIVVSFVFWRRLVPYGTYEKRKPKKPVAEQEPANSPADDHNDDVPSPAKSWNNYSSTKSVTFSDAQISPRGPKPELTVNDAPGDVEHGSKGQI